MASKKVKFPIGLKLALMVSIILALSLSVITVLVSYLVSADVRLTAENNNWTVNRWSAAAAENILVGIKSRSLLLIRNIDSLGSGASSGVSLSDVSSRFFRLNPDIACVSFVGAEGSSSGILINDVFGSGQSPAGPFSPARIASWLEEEGMERAAAGETLLLNGYPEFGIPFLVMFFPLPRAEGFSFSGAAAVFFSAESLAVLLGINETGAATFLVNGAGDALIRGNGLVHTGENLRNLSIVEQAISGDANNLQTLYKDADGVEYFGAFQRIPDADALVVTGVESQIIFRGIDNAIRRIIIISASVLILSILFISLYSRTISRPIKTLTLAAQAVEEGDYQPPFLTAKSGDEIGTLTDSFISMGRGLANFERFTNKSIVALARKGKLGRTGEKKIVTVCFALIRDFAGIAGNMSPKSLVGFVNFFLSQVVPCITKTGGMVDKYLTQSGVVVMALWGAGASSHPARDAFNCIRSVLMMRSALRRLNQKRQAQGSLVPPVKMGCGINSGEVIAGQMGSDERMEYTVIGDTVNLAARIEEPNDAFDTDILITENTRGLIGNYLLMEEMPSLEVKGKSKPLRVFSVVNLRNSYGPATMKEVRKLWR
ncbi:MAG: HAMP domain-containing protein [Treponema sp.]|jgi:adenylate cyclase|nr:HAMP domain-containing protein [Treponema sp.]